jgi:hypothetical protein
MNIQVQSIIETIDKNVEIVNQSLNWVNTSSMRGEVQENTYDILVGMRRKFNRIKVTFSDNPAAVMYGQSQVGKSYLINGLLSQGENFKVVDEQSGTSYDFLEDINPVGGGAEATSLVTRFSANYKPLNSEYPIKVKLMSPADIILTLSDSYYEDATNHPPFEDIDEKINAFIEKYASKASLANQAITEDDVLYIEEYFTKYFTSKVRELTSTKFFKTVSRHITKVPANEWADVFSVLWHGKKELADIFKKLITVYQTINFSDECYVQYDAVLRKYGTILNVTRLKEIDGTLENTESVPNFKKESDVLYLVNNAQKTVRLNKSELCALAYELVFKINEDLKTSKVFLNHMDILDFPGARSRLKNYASDIKSDNIPDMLLRGKIAYLFNKYSDSFLISNLLLCHHNRNLDARFMPRLLSNWISNFIGATPEEREQFIRDSGVPPLFVIGTMFNIDLQYNSTNDKTKDDLVTNRWAPRFSKIWEGEVFATQIKEGEWFNNWTVSNRYFNNIFMLRDFKWSAQERGGVYSGYEKTGREELVKIEGWTHGNFMDDLKESFVNYQFVKNHFDNPSAYWDAAVTPNKDGTALIIEKLTIAANNLERSRTQKFKRDLEHIINDVYDKLKSHFHDDDADKLIAEKINKAGKIQLELDVSFGKDPYFFGRLMQKFLLKESFIYNFYLEKINDIQLIDKANLSEYVAIRLANPGLKHFDKDMDKDALFDYNLAILQTRYKEPDAPKLKEYFEKRGIDLEELFFGETNIIKSNSVIMAEGLVEKWTTEVLNIDRFKDFVAQGFSENALIDLLDNMKLLFKQLDITKLIAQHIRTYVNRYNQIDVILEMIADISAEIINNFVNHIGFDHYSADKLADIREVDEKNGLGLVFDHNFLNFQSMDIEDQIKLFETLDRLPEILNQRPLDLESLKNVPNFSQYVKWSDLIKIGFVATCNIPTYNVEDNNRLRDIIDKYKSLNEINEK